MICISTSPLASLSYLLFEHLHNLFVLEAGEA